MMAELMRLYEVGALRPHVGAHFALDDYVAAFTRKIPRARVLRVASVLAPISDRATGAPVSGSALVGDVAAQILASDAPVPVVDASGRIVGSIDRKTVIETAFAGAA